MWLYIVYICIYIYNHTYLNLTSLLDLCDWNLSCQGWFTPQLPQNFSKLPQQQQVFDNWQRRDELKVNTQAIYIR